MVTEQQRVEARARDFTEVRVLITDKDGTVQGEFVVFDSAKRNEVEITNAIEDGGDRHLSWVSDDPDEVAEFLDMMINDHV